MNQELAINVRQAKIEDLPILLAFEQGIIEFERPYGDTIKFNTNYYDLASFLDADHVRVCVAVHDGVIVGSGYARIVQSKTYHTHNQYSYLGFMYVVPDYRGKGINQLIIDDLKDWSLKKGMNELRLNVYLDNEGAIKAYRKAGFTHNILEMRMPI